MGQGDHGKQQNQAFSKGALSAIQSLNSRVPSPDTGIKERMALWMQIFESSDPAVHRVFSHFLSAVDLYEILKQDQTWGSRLWTRQLWIHIMDLRWQYATTVPALKQTAESPVELNEELSRLWLNSMAQYRKLRHSRAIPEEFHITPDVVEVPRYFGKERRGPRKISVLETGALDGLDLL
jgi:hypothetical protein